MHINFLPIYNNKYPQNTISGVSYPNLAPFKRHDAVSFGAMKKSQFSGVNRMLVEKFKAPIEKFNAESDFQNWAKMIAKRIITKDFGGKQVEIIVQRKDMLKEWSDYVLKENSIYTGAMGLFIFSAMTQGLKSSNDKLPPVLNKDVLADCISEVNKNAADDRYQFNLRKMYETKLRAKYFESDTTTGCNTGWIVIPSKKNDPINYEANIDKLKALSHKNWYIKSFNAEDYLNGGDYHVYLENGTPKLSVIFFDNTIQEIKDEENNGKIPISYFEVIQKHISENNLKLSSNISRKLKVAKQINVETQNIKKYLNVAIENKDVKKIFKYFGIEAKEDENGYLTISSYWQPSPFFTFKDCGIDENVLFKKVKHINGDASFMHSQLTNLSELESIGGNANFGYSKITNLGKLESIGGDAKFGDSQIENLGKLKSIGRGADFEASQVINLGELESIGGSAEFRYSKIRNLGKLKSIGGSAYFVKSQVANLGELESIGRNANFGLSQITSLGKLKSIGEDANLEKSRITDLGALESVGKGIYLECYHKDLYKACVDRGLKVYYPQIFKERMFFN